VLRHGSQWEARELEPKAENILGVAADAGVASRMAARAATWGAPSFPLLLSLFSSSTPSSLLLSLSLSLSLSLLIQLRRSYKELGGDRQDRLWDGKRITL